MEILNNVIGTIFAMLSIMLSVVIDENTYRLLMHHIGLDKFAEWILRHHM